MVVSNRDMNYMSCYWDTLWGKLGMKLLFNITYHPQIDGRTEVSNYTLSALLDQ
jgi:hypothetical protein